MPQAKLQSTTINAFGGAGMTDIKEAVRQRYASAALEIAKGDAGCCGPGCCGPDEGAVSCGAEYSADEVATLGMDPRVSLGCGQPLLPAKLEPAEKVLDLGSGAGLDVLLSARRVAPGGHAYGLDMTGEMLELARRNPERGGIRHAP